MVLCKKCGRKTVLASRSVEIFYPDSEPYESGVVEDSEQEEIRACVDIGIYYCENCDRINTVWIESPTQDEI